MPMTVKGEYSTGEEKWSRNTATLPGWVSDLVVLSYTGNGYLVRLEAGLSGRSTSLVPGNSWSAIIVIVRSARRQGVNHSNYGI